MSELRRDPPSPEPAQPSGFAAGVLRYYRVYILLVAGVVLFGLWVFVSMPRSEDPEFDIFEAWVVTRYPGAEPSLVESLVTLPVEDALEEVDGIRRLEADSTGGLSVVHVTVASDADVAEVVEEMREQVEEIASTLPEPAGEPDVFGYNTGDLAVALVSLIGEGYEALDAAAEEVADALEEVDGVSHVEVEALPERQVRVAVDSDRLTQYGIPLIRIPEILARENAAVPGGKLDLEGRRYLLENPNQLTSLAEIGDVVIGNAGGSVVFLRDVATVAEGFEDPRYLARTDGRPAVVLAVMKRDGSNAVAVAERVRRRLGEIAGGLGPGLEIQVIHDRGLSVSRLLGNLFDNAVAGGVIVLVMVTLFLGFRQALVVSVSIPLSILLAILAMAAVGIHLNQVSIFGLVLALGMLVDSSLVVVENIGRHLEEGMAVKGAVTVGVAEVKWPVLSSMLTTAAAFVPLLFMTGNIGSFIAAMPATLIFALAGSFVVAMTVIPLLSFPLWKDRPPPPHPAPSRLEERYSELVKLALRRRAATVAVALTAFVLSLAAVPRLGIQFFPAAEKAYFLINVRLPDGVSLKATSRVVEQVEAVLAAEPAVKGFTVHLGKGGPRVYYNTGREQEDPSYAQVLVDLEEGMGPEVASYAAGLEAKLARITGAKIEPVILQQGPRSGAPIQIRVFGDDLATLSQLSRQVRERIADVPGMTDLRDSLGEAVPRLRMDLDKEKAGRLGIDSFDFSRTLFTALNGVTASQYRDGEEEIPLVVEVDEASFRDVDDIGRLLFPGGGGAVLPFSELATIRQEAQFPRIQRRDGRRVVTVEAEVRGRLASEVQADLAPRLASLELPAGYRLETGGEEEKRKESFAALGKALVLALFLIYGILSVQFNSFVQPFVILLTVPFGVIGAVAGLFVTGKPFGFMAFVGIVSLTGIIINDSIVLTDFANYLQRVRGMGMYESLLGAGRMRFRPVVLTSASTIAGMTPLAIWGGSLWSPLAVAVIFGLVGATALILLLLPVIYSLLVGPREGRRAFRLLPILWRRWLVG